MLQADFEEWLAKKERDIKQPPEPPRRRQPKITRHQSARMRLVQGQSRDPVKAIYKPESEYSQTPVHDDDFVGTKEVGPHDQYGAGVNNYRTGKATQGQPTYTKRGRQQRKPTGSVPQRQGKTDYDALADLFGG